VRVALSILVFLSLQPIFAQSANPIGSGNALEMDGVDDYVSLGPSFNNLNFPVTVMAWVKTNNQSKINPIFSSSGDPNDWHGIWLHCANNRFQAAFADGSSGFTPAGRKTKRAFLPFPLHTNWYHLCAVLNGPNDIRLYVNGIDVGGNYNGSANNWVNSSTGEATIGYHRRGSSDPNVYFNGSLDEVRIWDAALSVNQIREEMCRQADPSSPNLIGAWDFNEAQSSANLSDITNQVTGIRNGGTTTITSPAPIGNHSVFSYPFNNNQSQQMVVANEDSLNIHSNQNFEGLHIYRVDNLPSNQNGVFTSAPGIQHYYGVFATGNSDLFSFDYELLPPTSTNTKLKLAHRDNNASPTWTVYNNSPNPSLSQSNLLQQQEFWLVSDTCIGAGLLDPLYSGCDSISIQLPSTVNQVLWQDGSTALQRTFYQSTSLWVISTDNANCEHLDTISLQIMQASYTPVPDQESCNSITINLDPVLNNILWFDGSNQINRTFKNSGSYSYSASDPINGCSFVDSFNLKINGNTDLAQLINDSLTFSDLCFGDTLYLRAPQGTQVKWPDGSTESFTVSRSQVVRAEVSNSCSDTIVFLQFDFYDCDCQLAVPNAFTPNGDGLNDRIRPEGICDFIYYHWQIYNRWGNLVFESRNPEAYFEGIRNSEDCLEGTYIYKLQIETKHRSREEHGTITILR